MDHISSLYESFRVWIKDLNGQTPGQFVGSFLIFTTMFLVVLWIYRATGPKRRNKRRQK